MSPVASTIGSRQFGNFDIIFIALFGMCVFELFQTRFIAWKGVKMIKEGTFNTEWPGPYTGLILTIGFSSMFPLVFAIAIYLPMV